MAFTVRPATAADAADVVRINARAWQSAYAGMVPDDVLAGLDEVMDERAERTRERWSSSAPRNFSTVVAEDGHGVVGFVTYGPYRVGQSPHELAPHIGEVLAIYVEPARQGEGAGQALLDAAVEALRSDGVAEVRLWVLTENAPSRRFYERYGFRFDGQEHTYPMQRPDGSQVDLPEVRYRLAVGDHVPSVTQTVTDGGDHLRSSQPPAFTGVRKYSKRSKSPCRRGAPVESRRWAGSG